MTLFLPGRFPRREARHIGQKADSRRDIRHAEPYVIWRRALARR